MAQASRLGSRRRVLLGLYLASDLLGAELPQEVWRRVQAESAVQSLAERVRERLFGELEGASRDMENFLFSLQSKERLPAQVRDSLRFARHRMTPNEKDRALLPLPKPLSFLYYLIRPIRLAKRYGLRPWILLKRLLSRIQ